MKEQPGGKNAPEISSHEAPVEVAMVSHIAQVDHSVTADPKRAATNGLKVGRICSQTAFVPTLVSTVGARTTSHAGSIKSWRGDVQIHILLFPC